MADLTKYGLGAAGFGAGQPTGVLGAKSATATTATTPAPSPPHVPGPLEDPDAWGTVILATGTADDPTAAGWVWPPARGFGLVEITTADSEQKLDAQKASGKDKAKTKQAGIEPWKATMKVTIVAKYWDAAAGMVIDLNPNGPRKGQPWSIAHPEATIAGAKSIIVKKASRVAWKPGGQLGVVTYEIEEWVPPAKAAAGKGTSTPTTAGQAPTYGLTGIFQNTGDGGGQIEGQMWPSAQPTGFDPGSGSAPSGSYP